jgi:hypothetical protein
LLLYVALHYCFDIEVISKGTHVHAHHHLLAVTMQAIAPKPPRQFAVVKVLPGARIAPFQTARTTSRKAVVALASSSPGDKVLSILPYAPSSKCLHCVHCLHRSSAVMAFTSCEPSLTVRGRFSVLLSAPRYTLPLCDALRYGALLKLINQSFLPYVWFLQHGRLGRGTVDCLGGAACPASLPDRRHHVSWA